MHILAEIRHTILSGQRQTPRFRPKVCMHILASVRPQSTVQVELLQPLPRPPPRGPPEPCARLTVALPRARPTPRPRAPLLLNMGAFLHYKSACGSCASNSSAASIPHLSISGTMNSRTCEPRMYTRSRCVTRPSRWVTLMFSSCTFMLSSAAHCQSPLLQCMARRISRTFDELSAVCLAGGDLNRYLVAL